LLVAGDENKIAACFGYRLAGTQPHLTCRSNHSSDAYCITCTGALSLLFSILPGVPNEFRYTVLIALFKVGHY